MATEDELLTRLERWLAERPVPPTIFDIVDTGDAELLAAYVLKAFRSATAQAIVERLQHEDIALSATSSTDPGGPFGRAFDGLARAWSLREAEQLDLLGLERPHQLEALRTHDPADLPQPLLERLAILLDIFKAINTLLPVPHRADAWIRKPNAVPLFDGRSALHLMRESLEGLREVRAYLQGQLSGP